MMKLLILALAGIGIMYENVGWSILALILLLSSESEQWAKILIRKRK